LILFLWKSEPGIQTKAVAVVSHEEIKIGSVKVHKELFDVDDDDEDEDGVDFPSRDIPSVPAMTSIPDSADAPPVVVPTSTISSSSVLRKCFDEKLTSDIPRYAVTLLDKRLTQVVDDIFLLCAMTSLT
jgi:hypothetical protein